LWADEERELEETLVSTEVVFQGRVVRLRLDTVRLPSGREAKREVIAHPGAVAVIPLHDDGTVVLIRQFRQAAGQVLLEIPAGTLEPGEAPEECARRELAEETGLAAEDMLPLFASYLAPGYSSELLHVFLARGLRPAEGTPDADENIQRAVMPLAEAVRWILAGEIHDAKTICGLLLAERIVRDEHV
jgi:ADP-ribose pyrophosphatase